MRIISKTGNRIVDVGSDDIFYSLYSTIKVRVKHVERFAPLAMDFLQEGICSGKEAMAAARQINLIRDALAKVTPDQIVYDYQDLSKKAPWADNISPVITSGANYFTTADGKDLLFEIVSILVYAGITKTDVVIEK